MRSSSPGARFWLVALGIGAALSALWFLSGEERPPTTPGSGQVSSASKPAEQVSPEPALTSAPNHAARERGPEAPEAPAASRPARRPALDRLEEEGAARLRPVRGRVLDAATRQPIAGAWVTWRPPSAALVARLLPEVEPGDPGITDSAGYFVLKRLPSDLALADTVYAVAPGYGIASRRAALAAELTLALPAACELELLLDPPPPPGEGPPARVLLEPSSRDPDLQTLADRLEPWGSERHRYRIGHLPPGRYQVCVDPQVAGQRVYPVELRAGSTTQVRVARAPRAVLAGAFLRLPEAPEGLESGLAAVDQETLTRYELPLASDGSFEAELPRARYALIYLEGRSERLLPGDYVPGGDLQLEPPTPRPELQLELREAGRPLQSQELGLVRLDEPLGDLIALRPSERPGSYLARAAPGRYAIFLGTRWVAELDLPQRDPQALNVSAGSLSVTLALPPELRPEEEVRGTLSLVPEVLHEWRPDLSARFRAAARPFVVSAGSSTLRCPIGLPGRYRVVVESDLGGARQLTELASGGALSVSLEEP